MFESQLKENCYESENLIEEQKVMVYWKSEHCKRIKPNTCFPEMFNQQQLTTPE